MHTEDDVPLHILHCGMAHPRPTTICILQGGGKAYIRAHSRNVRTDAYLLSYLSISARRTAWNMPNYEA